MKKQLALLLFLLSTSQLLAQSQYSFFDGLYQINRVSHDGTTFQLYQFSRKNSRMRAKYFAQNASRAFNNWKENKKVVFVCAGAFSTSWDEDAPPVGICVDNGVIVNKAINTTMDGLVIIYNGGKSVGGVAMTNLEKEQVNLSQGLPMTVSLDIQSDMRDKLQFLKWAEQENATVFQTQLMYSKSFGYGFDTDHLRVGDSANRRFLATCSKNGQLYHVVIDMNRRSAHLNSAAYKVIDMLQAQGFSTIWGLINLDTGGKNIMKAYSPSGELIHQADKRIEEATNLLVYYFE